MERPCFPISCLLFSPESPPPTAGRAPLRLQGAPFQKFCRHPMQASRTLPFIKSSKEGKKNDGCEIVPTGLEITDQVQKSRVDFFLL